MTNKKSLDDILSPSAIGSVDRAVGNALYGMNHRSTGNFIPSNRDRQGYVFVVRPQLNMQKENLSNVRKFYTLLTDNPDSIDRYIRCTLDPRQQTGYAYSKKAVSAEVKAYCESIGIFPNTVPAINCSLVDPQQAFIPLITNMVQKVSGWPEMVVSTYTSDPGLYREAYAMVDSFSEMYEQYDLDFNFKGMKGNALLYLLWVWTFYPGLVFRGDLARYPDYRRDGRLDYTTRVWRLTMDESNEKVSLLMASGASFWVSSSIAGFADYDRTTTVLDPGKDFTIRMKCLGFQYFDPILIQEFNKTVTQFNLDMTDYYRDKNMMRVPKHWLGHFNFRGYPRINENTMYLEWYVSNDLYNMKTADFLSTTAGESFLTDFTDI